MTSIIDAEDIYLDAKAEVEEVISDAMAEWFIPLVRDSLATYLLSLPDDVVENLTRLAGENSVNDVMRALQKQIERGA